MRDVEGRGGREGREGRGGPRRSAGNTGDRRVESYHPDFDMFNGWIFS